MTTTTGSGIEGAGGPDEAANFDAFAARIRAGSHATDGGTHGLGTNIVKQLCESIGSRMTLRSCVGRGTRFRFVLPLADADLIAATVAANAAARAQQAKQAALNPDFVQ